MKLTPRQHQIACMAASYLPRPEIARRLGITRGAVDRTLNRLFHALGVSSRRQLAPALLHVHVRPINGGGRSSRLGLERGDPVRITGGRFEGFRGTYHSGSNSQQVRVQIGGGVFALRARFVERETK